MILKCQPAICEFRSGESVNCKPNNLQAVNCKSANLQLQSVTQSIGEFRVISVSRCRGVVVITNAQLHATKFELKLCRGSNPSPGVSEIWDGEDLWQWPWLEIKLNAFHRSTIPQKQFIIIICTFSAYEIYCDKRK